MNVPQIVVVLLRGLVPDRASFAAETLAPAVDDHSLALAGRKERVGRRARGRRHTSRSRPFSNLPSMMRRVGGNARRPVGW